MVSSLPMNVIWKSSALNHLPLSLHKEISALWSVTLYSPLTKAIVPGPTAAVVAVCPFTVKAILFPSSIATRAETIYLPLGISVTFCVNGFTALSPSHVLKR